VLLAAQRLDWYLFGARAAQLRGLRRATVDVDITVFAGARDASVVAEALASAFSVRVHDVADFVRTTRVLPLLHGATDMPVDAVLGAPGLEQYFLERAERVEHQGVPVVVPRAEDLVVMKLLAGRDHDLDDALAIVAFDPAAVDLVAVRSLLGEIEAGIGEGGLVAALDHLEQRLGIRRSPPPPEPPAPPRRAKR
jgi:hypothetical protein